MSVLEVIFCETVASVLASVLTKMFLEKNTSPLTGGSTACYVDLDIKFSFRSR